jgi:nucleoside-diphosphate-sugar epimerase
VNAVSLYAESGPRTFHSVHVEAATRVARLAREVGVGRFIHVSGIGSDAGSASIPRMLRRLPVFPLFGRGQTQLQPAYVEDVADAIARVMQNTQSPMCYELGGPRVYAYRSLLEVIARHLVPPHRDYDSLSEGLG